MEALPLLTKFGVRPSSIVHVGANTGYEFELYKAAGVSTVVYIEPISSIFAVLKERVAGAEGHHPIQALCSDRSGQHVRFNIANNSGESSSMFPLSDHARLFPSITYTDHEELVTTTLDDVLRGRRWSSRSNLLAIDTQGAELLVLKGAAETLAHVDAIFTEVSERPLYEGSCVWPEIHAFLEPLGFHLKHMDITRFYFGNALYMRNTAFFSPLNKIAVERVGQNIALNKPARQSSTCIFSRTDDAQGAVSGKIRGSFSFHTDKELGAWWEVDLGEARPLREVLVFNRLDVASERAYSFTLLLAEDEGSYRQVYRQDGRRFGGADGHPARIPVPGQVARWVRIALETEDHLHLDQVEVYAQE